MLALVNTRFEQVKEFRGLSPEKPFENIGIEGFYKMLAVFRLTVVQQEGREREGMFLDRLTMRHRVTGQEIVLRNRVQAAERAG